MTSNTEKRFSFTPDTASEYRAKVMNSDNASSRKIKGYGVVFNQRSKIITEYIPEKGEWRTFYEVIKPEAFDNIFNTLSSRHVVLNMNHRSDEILATSTSGTLIIERDNKGITYETEAPETSRGEDALVMVKRGDYFESSFQFILAENGDSWALDQSTNIWVRTITNIETLIDLCIATYRGAYSNTSIEAGKRIEFNEYDQKDIAVAKRKLDELIDNSVNRIESSEPVIEIPIEDNSYQAELELDNDILKSMSN